MRGAGGNMSLLRLLRRGWALQLFRPAGAGEREASETVGVLSALEAHSAQVRGGADVGARRAFSGFIWCQAAIARSLSPVKRGGGECGREGIR